jgi:hypothetical protein
MKRLLARAFLTAIAVWSMSACTSEETMLSGNEVKRELEVLAKGRVLLGHQSVGRDVLSGVKLLAADAGVPVRLEAITDVPSDSGPGLFDSSIGSNGDPDSKCQAFEGLLAHSDRPEYDAALMKFCYVDLSEKSALDASKLFERYVALVNRLKQVRPDVTIIHVTMPLRSDPLEWKTPIKRLIGRSTYEDDGNVLRNDFNDKLRTYYANEPIFDIARVQALRADGSLSSFEYNGRTVYTLAKEYTYDGGHLNEVGQRHVAAEFVRTVAKTLESSQAAAEPVNPT